MNKYQYICPNCKDRFNEFEYKRGEAEWYQGALFRRDIGVCPSCGSEEYIPVFNVMNKVESVLDEYELNMDDLADLIMDRS